MRIDPQILNSVCGLHPAATMPFDELYSGLMKEVEQGNVYFSTSPEGLQIFNYSIDCQFDGKWNLFSLISRGLILDPQNKKVVALPYPKFFNYLEASDTLPDKPFEVFEKADGCCDENTIIITENGNKTIKEICDSKYYGKVLSFNIDKFEVEYDIIINHFVQDNNDDWYKIELENGEVIILTGNHKVFLPELRCYRRVSDLNGDEKFLLKK